MSSGLRNQSLNLISMQAKLGWFDLSTLNYVWFINHINYKCVWYNYYKTYIILS